MARLITVTKVGLYDINGSYFAVDSESIRVYDQNISSIETHTSGASLMFGNPQVTPEGVTVKGFVPKINDVKILEKVKELNDAISKIT